MRLCWRDERDARGIQQIVLENESLRLTVLPELGGRLWSIIDLAQDEEILWHHPTLQPHGVAPGTGYDDAFAGGWDELFPSDRAVTLDGIAFPDHGEWWSQPWAWQITEGADALRLTLSGSGFATHHAAVRTITLPRAGSGFAWRTQITNTGGTARPRPYAPVAAWSCLTDASRRLPKTLGQLPLPHSPGHTLCSQMAPRAI